MASSARPRAPPRASRALPGRSRLARSPLATTLATLLLLASSARALNPHPTRRFETRPPPARRAHHRAHHRPAARPTTSAAAPLAPSPAPPERWVTQPLDHFDALEPRTWRQRYFANTEHFDAAARSARPPLAFLCVGGEGPPFTPDVVTTGGPHCALAVEMAKTRGALVLALEHRFYGPSQPTGDLAVASLRFLSSEQALADLAAFVEFATAKFGLSPPAPRGATKWVAFGGSYPGMLAGWARVKYPHLIHAAVASSAPVQASLAMPGYDRVVGEALLETDVGGSAACLTEVKEAFKALGEEMASAEGRRRVERAFGVKNRTTTTTTAGTGGTLPMMRGGESSVDDASFVFPLEAPFDRVAFLETLTELFPAQSNDPACASPACDIRRVCGVMIDGADPSDAPGNRSAADAFGAESLNRLVDLAAIAFAGEPVDADADADIAAMRAAAVLPADPAALRDEAFGGDRSWFWQTCVEFGFYQTCDDRTCPFFWNASTSADVSRIRRPSENDAGSGSAGSAENSADPSAASAPPPLHVPLDAFTRVCALVFGLDVRAVVHSAPSRANARYGGWAPGGTRILYPSGSVDPWRANSLTPDREFSAEWAPATMVPGASHHAWTHPSRPGDQASVVKAREEIAAVVDAWVNQGPIAEAGEEGGDDVLKIDDDKSKGGEKDYLRRARAGEGEGAAAGTGGVRERPSNELRTYAGTLLAASGRATATAARLNPRRAAGDPAARAE